MKKAIIFYSKTGNTRAVAIKLNSKMNVDIFEVKAQSDDPSILNPILIVSPDVNNYDHLVFAAPVHGFNLCRIMYAYLTQLPNSTGKTADLFVTHFFPFAWMGGNRSLKQMEKILVDKNIQVLQMTSINWKSKKRESVIIEMIDNYSK